VSGFARHVGQAAALTGGAHDRLDELRLLQALVTAHVEVRGDALEFRQLLAGEDARVHPLLPER
jgi:transketolase C-terminal domain/subunit